MNQKTDQNEDIKRKIEAAGMNANGAGQPVPTYDQNAPVHTIETAAADQVLQMLGQVPYALAQPIIATLVTNLRPLEDPPG